MNKVKEKEKYTKNLRYETFSKKQHSWLILGFPIKV